MKTEIPKRIKIISNAENFVSQHEYYLFFAGLHKNCAKARV
jgi:hypothetical protein